MALIMIKMVRVDKMREAKEKTFSYNGYEGVNSDDPSGVGKGEDDDNDDDDDDESDNNDDFGATVDIVDCSEICKI